MKEKRLTVSCSSRTCPICASSKSQELHRQNLSLFSDHPLSISPDNEGNKYLSVLGINLCRNCGTIYNSPIPNQGTYHYYYNQWSRYSNGTDSLCGRPSAATASRFKDTVNLVASHIPSFQARILDVGCLDGGLLHAFKSQGYSNLHGVDPAELCTTRPNNSGITFLTGTVSSIPFQDAFFDLILCVHMLEHVRDLDKLDIFRVLAPGGRVYIEVPDTSAYTSSSRDIFSDISLEHINHFSHTSLSNLLRNYGFRAIIQGSRSYPITGKPGQVQPSIFGIFEKETCDVNKVPFDIDTETSKTFSKYLLESIRSLSNLEQRIQAFISDASEIHIWGAGHAGFRILGLPLFQHSTITSITDSNSLYWGKQLHGTVVTSPSEFRGSNGHVIITSALHASEIISCISDILVPSDRVFAP